MSTESDETKSPEIAAPVATTGAGMPLPTPAQPQPDAVYDAFIAARHAVEELVKIAGDSIKEANHPSFTTRLWELLRDHAIKEVGLPSKAAMPALKLMLPEHAKVFGADEMPRGKYVEQTVGQVYDQEPDYLRAFSEKPDPWYTTLRAYIIYRDKLAAEKAEHDKREAQNTARREKLKTEKPKASPAEAKTKSPTKKGKPGGKTKS